MQVAEIVRVRDVRTSGDAAEVHPTLQGSVGIHSHSLYSDSCALLTVTLVLHNGHEEKVTAEYLSKGASRDVWKGRSQSFGHVVIKLEATKEQGGGTSVREVELRQTDAVRQMTGEIFFRGEVEVWVEGRGSFMTGATKKKQQACRDALRPLDHGVDHAVG
jgi:hypothetical protein